MLFSLRFMGNACRVLHGCVIQKFHDLFSLVWMPSMLPFFDIFKMGFILTSRNRSGFDDAVLLGLSCHSARNLVPSFSM